MILGEQRIQVGSCASTQELVDPSMAEGTVAVADMQSAGRGRLVVSEIHSTLMACADLALMEADAAVAGLLRGTSEWRIAESYPEQLILEHADGRRSSWVADRPAP